MTAVPLASVDPRSWTGSNVPVRWQVRAYRTPEDKRMTLAAAPKINVSRLSPSDVEDWWLPPRPLSMKDVSVMLNEKYKIQQCLSLPNTRDEKWSTLMEMSPTRGYHNPPFTRDPDLAATPPRRQEQKEHESREGKGLGCRTSYGGLRQAKTICEGQANNLSAGQKRFSPSPGLTETT